ncbi:hypothetical protein C8Q75DRAFT_740987 [Abortiporus biennis]|nr:hypothetical protein C8Q75DRAFT_740987 [Abortiporus biennis]
MIDTFIANANVEDLRAIVRSTIATNPSTTAAFGSAARQRMTQGSATGRTQYKELFVKSDGETVAGPDLSRALVHARSLYGVGLGVASLKVLACILRATIGHRWEEGGILENVFAEIDADVSQGLQSTREEIESGRLSDKTVALSGLGELRSAIQDSKKEVERWGGVYPFERAASSMAYWKLA